MEKAPLDISSATARSLTHTSQAEGRPEIVRRIRKAASEGKFNVLVHYPFCEREEKHWKSYGFIVTVDLDCEMTVISW